MNTAFNNLTINFYSRSVILRGINNKRGVRSRATHTLPHFCARGKKDKRRNEN